MNTTQTTLQIRIDQKTKKKAMETFEAMGLDISSGVKLFLNQVIKDEALPFRPAISKLSTISSSENSDIVKRYKKPDTKIARSVRVMI